MLNEILTRDSECINPRKLNNLRFQNFLTVDFSSTCFPLEKVSLITENIEFIGRKIPNKYHLVLVPQSQQWFVLYFDKQLNLEISRSYIADAEEILERFGYEGGNIL